jgi:serine/threonine protein phosphatase PrpC
MFSDIFSKKLDLYKSFMKEEEVEDSDLESTEDINKLIERLNSYLNKKLSNKEIKKCVLAKEDSKIYIEDSIEQIYLDTLTYDDAVLCLLRESFLEMSEIIDQKKIGHGTTSAIVYIENNKAYIANAGDTRVVVCSDKTPNTITTDHQGKFPSKPGKNINEERRIKELGGFVSGGRVNGVLAVSRAIGDNFLEPMLTADPNTYVIDIDEKTDHILIACDGVWDVLSDSTACNLILGEEDPRVSSFKIRNKSFEEGSGDNISCLVIKFKKDYFGKNEDLEIKKVDVDLNIEVKSDVIIVEEKSNVIIIEEKSNVIIVEEKSNFNVNLDGEKSDVNVNLNVEEKFNDNVNLNVEEKSNDNVNLNVEEKSNININLDGEKSNDNVNINVEEKSNENVNLNDDIKSNVDLNIEEKSNNNVNLNEEVKSNVNMNIEESSEIKNEDNINLEKLDEDVNLIEEEIKPKFDDNMKNIEEEKSNDNVEIQSDEIKSKLDDNMNMKENSDQNLNLDSEIKSHDNDNLNDEKSDINLNIEEKSEIKKEDSLDSKKIDQN